MKNIILIALLGVLFSCSTQKNTNTNLTSATIMTSSECGMCKKTIEGAFENLEGMVYARLDVPTKKLKVKFDSAKISIDEIRQVVASVGYDADDVASNSEAYEALPACCQKGGMDKH